MPEAARREHHAAVLSSERNPFRVLRLMPAKFLHDCDDPLIIGRVDLVQRDYKLLLFDCELRCEPDLAEAYVHLPGGSLRVVLVLALVQVLIGATCPETPIVTRCV